MIYLNNRRIRRLIRRGTGFYWQVDGDTLVVDTIGSTTVRGSMRGASAYRSVACGRAATGGPTQTTWS